MKSALRVSSLSSVHPKAVFCFVSFDVKGVPSVHIGLRLSFSGRTHQKLVPVMATELTREQGKKKSILENTFYTFWILYLINVLSVMVKMAA